MTPVELKNYAQSLGPAGCRRLAQAISERLTKAGHTAAANEIFNASYRDPVDAYVRGHYVEKDLQGQTPAAAVAPGTPSTEPQTLAAVRAAMETETDPERKWDLALKAREMRGHADLFALSFATV